MKYILIDGLNTFFRMKHVHSRSINLEERIGLTILTLIRSINRLATNMDADHVILCLDGSSVWRKAIYPSYKKQRASQRQKRTEAEIQEDSAYIDAFNEFIRYMTEETNCSVLYNDTVEADDLIARFTQNHPEDEHVILSSDSDMIQLISSNIRQYDGVKRELFTINGIFDINGKRILDKHGKEKTLEDPEWLLFLKCIRGDTTDNIFSAYPGARVKSSKNKVGLIEAFEDRHKKGYSWNNVMMQHWSDHEEKDHKVLEDYERNRILIDLSMQPDEVKQSIDQTFNEQLKETTLPAAKIGFHFMKFCGKYNIPSLLDNVTEITTWMRKGYDRSKISS